MNIQEITIKRYSSLLQEINKIPNRIIRKKEPSRKIILDDFYKCIRLINNPNIYHEKKDEILKKEYVFNDEKYLELHNKSILELFKPYEEKNRCSYIYLLNEYGYTGILEKYLPVNNNYRSRYTGNNIQLMNMEFNLHYLKHYDYKLNNIRDILKVFHNIQLDKKELIFTYTNFDNLTIKEIRLIRRLNHNFSNIDDLNKKLDEKFFLIKREC